MLASTISVWAAAFLAVISALVALYAAGRISGASTSIRRLQSRANTHEELLEELAEWAKRIEARDKMRRVRAAKPATSSEPDQGEKPNPHTHPAEWKAFMRARMKGTPIQTTESSNGK